MKKFLYGLTKAVQAVVPGTSPEVATNRVLGMMATWVQRQPDLLLCLDTKLGQETLRRAVLEAAAMDLPVDGVAGHAYIIPFKDHGVMTAVLVIGYKGYLQLLYRSGQIKRAGAWPVFEGEAFRYSRGQNQVLQHEPQSHRDRLWVPETKKVSHVYGYFETITGGFEFDVWTWGEVMTIKDRSRGASSSFSPWSSKHASDVLWMARKTLLRQIAKLAPISVIVHHLIAREERFDDRTLNMVEAGNDFFTFDGGRGQSHVDFRGPAPAALPQPAVEREIPGVNAPAPRRERAPVSDPATEQRRQEAIRRLDESDLPNLPIDSDITPEETDF